MDVVTMLSLCLIFCGKDHAKDLNPTTIVHGNNGTVYINISKTDGKTLLEINFSGYTSNQHFTNVVLYMPVKGQKGNISINSNYTGRIESVVNNNGHFSFLLLNVMFNDSGNYTVKENSSVNGYTSVLVARHVFVARLGEPITLSFIIYENNTPSVRVDNPNSKVSQPVVMYNSTNDSCTYTNFGSEENKNIHNCMLRKGEFSFSFPEIEWLHKGSYFAWNHKGRLLDSLFLDIQDNNLTGHVVSPRSFDIGTEKPLLYVVLGIGGIIIAFLAFLRHKYRIRLRVDKMSNFDTFKECNKDDEEEIKQEEILLGGYLTVVSSERGEFSTAIELEFVQCSDALLFRQNVVPAKNEIEHPMKLDNVKRDDALDGYLNPVHSCSVEFDEYINPITLSSVEFDECIRPINSSPVNSEFVSTSQSTGF